MSRFFFQIADEPISDEIGVEQADLTDARHTATRYLGQLLAQGPDDFWSSGDWSLTVADDNDVVLFAIRVSAYDAPVTQTVIIPNGV